MLRLTLKGGRVYVGKDRLDIVRKMKDNWFSKEPIKKSEYKDIASTRIFKLYGKIIDKSKFIDSLVEQRLGFLEEIPTS